MRIIQDAITNSFLILAVLIMLYFIFVVDLLQLMIYPMLLLVGTLILRVFVNKKLAKDEDIQIPEAKNIGMYYIFALAGIGIGSFLISGLYDFPIEKYFQLSSSFSVVDVWLFTVLMAVVEEHFFRGELLEWMSSTMTPTFAVIASAALFMGYHLGVYGTQPENLLYVFVGGLSLSYVTIRSRRLSPSLLAHVTNNLLSVMTV